MNNLIHIKKNLNNYNSKKKHFYSRKLLKNYKKFKKKDNKELKNKNQRLHNLQNLEYLCIFQKAMKERIKDRSNINLIIL